MKRIRIFVIRWQKSQSGRKTETTDVHAPDIEQMKRTGNEYVTMVSVQQAKCLQLSDRQQTNMYWTIRMHTECITEKLNTEWTSTGACRIQQGIFANAFLQQLIIYTELPSSLRSLP